MNICAFLAERFKHKLDMIAINPAQTVFHILRRKLISADSDSSLVYDGDGSLEVSGLTADASGVGTIKGFSFAASGTLYLTGVSSGSTVVDISANLSGIENLSRAKDWELSVNGGDSAKYTIASVTSTGIRVVKPAFKIIFR